jgi:hypothetical protein
MPVITHPVLQQEVAMASPDAQELNSYVPLSMSYAEPGWRAMISTDTDPTGLVIRPVVGWAVFHFTTVSAETGALVTDLGNVIEGVVTWRDGLGVSLVCAQSLGRAVYLGPDMGEPPDADAVLGEPAQELGRR